MLQGKFNKLWSVILIIWCPKNMYLDDSFVKVEYMKNWIKIHGLSKEVTTPNLICISIAIVVYWTLISVYVPQYTVNQALVRIQNCWILKIMFSFVGGVSGINIIPNNFKIPTMVCRKTHSSSKIESLKTKKGRATGSIKAACWKNFIIFGDVTLKLI